MYLPLVLHSALPDSTMPFAALALAACALMPRLLRGAETLRLIDWRLLALGALIGLTALTRNEAAFIGFAWLVVVWLRPGIAGRRKVALVAVPAVVALAIFAPWMVRDWLEFGNPLPGQALANALSVTGFDIFAWSDPPTLSRYLAVGPGRLLEMRIEGLAHNLFTVLLIPGFPTSFVGLVALPFFFRLASLAPLSIVSVTTFLVTSLVFPVSTTWGTYLHAAGPAHVLLIVSALLGLDAFIEWVGEKRGWTRPVAWLGPDAHDRLVAAVPRRADRDAVRRRPVAGHRDALRGDRGGVRRGRPADRRAGTDHHELPGLAGRGRPDARALALPNESPESVLDLARTFGSRLLVVVGDQHGDWPAVLDSGGPGADCFSEVALPPPTDPAKAEALDEIRVFEVVCP